METERWKDGIRGSEGGRESMDTGCTRIGRGHGGVAPGAVVSGQWRVHGIRSARGRGRETRAAARLVVSQGSVASELKTDFFCLLPAFCSASSKSRETEFLGWSLVALY